VNSLSYQKALELLHDVATPNGFLASAENTSNYKRVWARDGVICGLSALASGDKKLIETFKNTLETLANNQHDIGTIPSNVLISDIENEVSYGGLAGRVDAVTWFIIGICQYAYYQDDMSFVAKYNAQLEKCFKLLNAWEFNNKHLLYVPLSGNWADEYITDGYTLYDQLLRVWALKSYNHFAKNDVVAMKIQNITEQIEINFTPPKALSFVHEVAKNKYHEKAYEQLNFQDFAPCSFSPSGYKTEFDGFANSLMLLLNIGSNEFQNKIVNYSFSLASQTKLGLLPAFWPPIFENDEHWNLLKNNCKYEFRNFPYEFHNGGSWSMVNGFFGLALLSKFEKEKSAAILDKINEANSINEYSFYENFNTQTKEPNGVAFCAWSAAAAILVHQSLHNNFKLLL
jgi:GH15 family glucan-1,4-alpha-glucosidase